jgi:uncharacterized protein (TIGR02118 family)
MYCLSVIYPNRDGARFDLDYYTGTHMSLVEDRLRPGGLLRYELERGVARWGTGEPAPFVMICHMYFNTLDELQRAFGEHSAELIGDIKVYTDIQPVMQISEIVR